MIRSDCHLHSSFSSDSTAPLESMVLRGIQLGLTSMCMTEHLDYDYPPNEEGLDFLLDFDAYIKEFNRLKEKYAHQITLLFGIELGLLPHLNQRYKKITDTYDFDFVIGSSHIVDGMDPYEADYFQKYSSKEGLYHYFETILENIEHCQDVNYQVYGHLDYVIRYAPEKNTFFQFCDYQEIIDEILKKLIALGKGIEVNTAGLKYGLGQPNPHIDILKRYADLGGEILTIGSDGHKPEHMAYDFAKLPAILKEAGFDHYTLFVNQKPQTIPL
jgi:histidinol-phosphatase (PHP family)